MCWVFYRNDFNYYDVDVDGDFFYRNEEIVVWLRLYSYYVMG